MQQIKNTPASTNNVPTICRPAIISPKLPAARNYSNDRADTCHKSGMDQ
ncbi:MAG: hypothetical protein U0X91_28700 [Spirosomataceae bacterium]